VHDDAALLLRGLGVKEHGHLETAGGAGVCKQLESEFLGVFCLDAVCDLLGILVVASPSAEVDEDKVGRFF